VSAASPSRPEAQLALLTEGPSARRRAYLQGIGYDDEALARRSSAWRDVDGDDACNFHLRVLAARSRRDSRRRGHADGVQHDRYLRRHHDGHSRMTSLVSREVIADSIELVSRGTSSTPSSR